MQKLSKGKEKQLRKEIKKFVDQMQAEFELEFETTYYKFFPHLTKQQFAAIKMKSIIS